MASYSLNFPDDEILQILGDDIEVIDDNGISTLLKGVFEYKYLDEELGDRVGVHYPVVEINNADIGLFKRKYTVIFNGEEFSVLNVIPADMGKSLVIMRDK